MNCKRHGSKPSPTLEMGPAPCRKPPHQISTDRALAPKPPLQTLHCPSVTLLFLIAPTLHPWGHPSPHQGEGGSRGRRRPRATAVSWNSSGEAGGSTGLRSLVCDQGAGEQNQRLLSQPSILGKSLHFALPERPVRLMYQR